MVKTLRNWYRYCVNLVYPLKCVVCNLPISPEEPESEFLCPSCFTKIKFIIPPVCEKCGRPSNYKICPECNKKHNLFFDRAFSVAIYDSIWKELIHLFKYGRNDCLDKFFAKFLFDLININPSLEESDLIIPVPLHWKDRWNRGYNQTYLLAYQVSKMISIPILDGNLIKCKKISSQTTLSGKERLKNVKGAFTVKNSKVLKDRKILLIDDVFTTGSTVNECSKVLRGVNVSKINVITLACSC